MIHASTPAGDDYYALQLRPGCDAPVTHFASTAWEMGRVVRARESAQPLVAVCRERRIGQACQRRRSP